MVGARAVPTVGDSELSGIATGNRKQSQAVRAEDDRGARARAHSLPSVTLFAPRIAANARGRLFTTWSPRHAPPWKTHP